MEKDMSGIKVTVNEEDLKKQGVIYLLEFPNGKVYIGQTTQKLQNRIRHHCYTKSGCLKVKNAIQKYKEFKVSVLEENLTIGQLNAFEPYYIKLFKSNGEDGYNLEQGGCSYQRNKPRVSQSIKMKGRFKQKVKSSPDNITFESCEEAELYYRIALRHLDRYYNGNIHKPSGQTFIKIGKRE